MIESIEVQVISRLITTSDKTDIDTLLSYDISYFAQYNKEMSYIIRHHDKYDNLPDRFEFLTEFPDFAFVEVTQPIEYLCQKLKEYKKYLILLETFNKIKDLNQGDVDDAWDYLNMQCERAGALQDSEPMNIVKEAEKRANQILEYNKQKRIPTGFPELDKLMYGGLSTVEELFLIVARTNAGKAQPLWAPVLTPSGWTTMGQVKVGDLVVGANNDNGRIIQIFPQGEKDYYRITFDDDTIAECCDDHLWTVLDSDRRERSNSHYAEPLVLTTRDIRNNLNRRYSVDLSSPIEFISEFDQTSELDPYLLGLLLGDGSFRDGRAILSSYDEEIWDSISNTLAGYNCTRSGKDNTLIKCSERGKNPVRNKLVEYGLMNKKSVDKFIPKQFLAAPVNVRMALLSGLVDTDGYVPKGAASEWEFDTASEQLAQDFACLARSLGVWVKVHERVPSYYTTPDGIRHPGAGSRHLVCRSSFNPFRLSRKASRYSNRTTPKAGTAPKRYCKMIQSIEYIGKTECQCILLDNNSHTYITSDYTITHNTWFCTKMMESAQRNGFNVAYYSPEMQSAYMGTRFDTWRGHFSNSMLYKGDYSIEYKEYIKTLPEDTASAFIIEDKDYSDGVTVNKLDTFVGKHNIQLLIIDGISYMTDDKHATRDQEKYKNIATDLFKLSKKHGCAVVLVMQANRDVKNKDDKGESIPDLYNTENSDAPGRVATQAVGLRQIFDKHVLDIKLLKSRMAINGGQIMSYSWDVNNGNMQFLGNGSDDISTSVTPDLTPAVTAPILSTNYGPDASTTSLVSDDEDDIEF